MLIDLSLALLARGGGGSFDGRQWRSQNGSGVLEMAISGALASRVGSFSTPYNSALKPIFIGVWSAIVPTIFLFEGCWICQVRVRSKNMAPHGADEQFDIPSPPEVSAFEDSN